MEAETWGFIGVLVGAASSIVTTVMVARDASSQRSKESQRNNLIELQDSLTVAMRLTNRIIHLKELTEIEKAEGSKELMASNQSLSTRTERIVDQSLREKVRNLHELIVTIQVLKIRDPNNEKVNSVFDLSEEVTKSVGVVLRSLY